MRIGIGSRVKFLNEKGGGIVRGFRDDKFALVETSDGFEVPFPVGELVPDEPVSYDAGRKINAEAEKKNVPPKKKKLPAISYEEKKYAGLKGSALLALVPENEQILHVSNFNLYLLNDSNYNFLYTIGFRESDVYNHIRSGNTEPKTKKEISRYSQSEIAKVKEFRIQGIFYKHGLFSFSVPFDMSFNIEEVSFYKASFFKENSFFNKKALILQKEDPDLKVAVEKLTQSEIAKVTRIKEQAEAQELLISRPPKGQTIEEIDLHIEEIIDDYENLSNGEILEIQLGRFETALDTALLSKVQKIVFIHGVGNGKLKYELIKKLERKYPQLKYQDASFREYGYGATMVYLK